MPLRLPLIMFFNHYNGNGWRYSKNGRVHNWKSELFAFDQRGKKWEKEKAAKTIARVQQADKEAETLEAKAAAEAFFDKFCRKSAK